MSKLDELVLGLPRSSVPGGLDFRGVRGVPLDEYLDACQTSGTFRRRGDAEADPDWKQIIPYVLLRDGERIFLMHRTRAGGDERLHDLYSIGVGGHVNPDDGGVQGGMRREWSEELDADFEPDFRPLGILNDDATPVGQVHLGLVFVVDAGGARVSIRERDKLEGGFASLAEVEAVVDRMEGWSALLFDYLADNSL